MRYAQSVVDLVGGTPLVKLNALTAGLRPLVRRQSAGAPPLLRSTVLPARMARPWPGAADAGEEPRSSRRRQAPPAVLPGWLDEEPA